MLILNLVRKFRLLPTLSLLSLLLIPAPLVRAGTPVGGPIISDTTWTLAQSPYIVVANVEVWEGVTLTIEPGVEMRFDPEKLLQVKGTLVARGTPDARILFTSNQPEPQPGNWGNIEFTDSSEDAAFDAEGDYTGGSVLQYCTVEYTGSKVYSWGIDARNAAPFIDHCIVQHNTGYGPLCVAGGTAENPAIVSNNIVSGINARHSTVNGNIVSGNDGTGIYAKHSTVNGNTVSANDGTGISAEHSTVNGNIVSGNDGGGIYASSSTVTDNTISSNFTDSIGGGITASSSMVTGNIISGNTAWAYLGLGDGGGIYAYNNSTVSGNIVNGNSAGEDGGGIYAAYSTVTGNTVSGNSASRRGGGIYAGGGVVSYNTVTGNLAKDSGGGIYAAYGTVTVTGNTVSGNTAEDCGGIYAWSNTKVLTNTVTYSTVAAGGHGAGVCHWSSYDFIGNTVVGNSGPVTQTVGGVAISGTPQFHHNNIYDNEPYDVVVLSSSDISGTLNYWGTVAAVDILEQVYDWYDDSSRGKLLYMPYLQDPDLDAPVPPPRNFSATFTGDTAQLSWDPIPSTTTGYGYKVYYDSDASGAPYEGSGLPEGDAPIDVGNDTSFTLTGLGGERYYVTVTAYDTHGRESWYSKEVTRPWKTFLPLVAR